MGMLARIASALAAFAVGCAPGVTYLDTGDAPELRAEAAEAWAAVGVGAPAYTLVVLNDYELHEACNYPQGDPLGGCTFPEQGDVVLLGADFPREAQLVHLMHELGHLTRGEARTHLQCEPGASADVMCLQAPRSGTVPSARDAAFALGYLE